MGSTDHGTQKIVHQYFEDATSAQWGKRHKDIRPRGIYSGGYFAKVSDTEVTLSPFVAEIGDNDVQVSVRTASTATLKAATLDSGSISSSTPYIIMRWGYVATPANYLEIHAIASIAAAQANDIIVGKCVFSGSTLTGFDYTDRTFLNVQNLFLKVEPSEVSEMYVRVRAGRIQNTTGYVAIADQKVGPFSVPSAPNSRIDLVYVDTDGIVKIQQGTAAVSPSPPSYDGKLVLAQVRIVNGDTNIPVSRITDARAFLTSSPTEQTSFMPRWTVKLCAANNYTLPSQFVSPLVTFSYPSLGSISIPSVVSSGAFYDDSTLFTMRVNSNGSQTKTLKLFSVDNWIYIYLNDSLVYSKTSVYASGDNPTSIALNLVNGVNKIEIVWADQGVVANLILLGDIVDNVNVKFVQP